MCWTCDHPEATREHRSEEHCSEEHWVENVRSRIPDGGVTVQAVTGPGRPTVAYTVGLTRLGHAELLVTGVSASVAEGLLGHVAAYVIERSVLLAGETMEAGPWRLEVVRVPHADVHLPTSVALYGVEVSALQLVWADPHGLWPWDPGHGGGSGGQPVLGARASSGCGHRP